ncbi:MAG: hypothetical protein WD492_12895 [Alkalispirochaeta sp.]
MRVKSRRGLPLTWDGRVYPADSDGYCEIPEDVALRAGFVSRQMVEKPVPNGTEGDEGGEVLDVDLEELDKDGLVEIATRLKVDSPSNLKRWGEDRLREEIRKAADAQGGEEDNR